MTSQDWIIFNTFLVAYTSATTMIVAKYGNGIYKEFGFGVILIAILYAMITMFALSALYNLLEVG